jgi:hypothetical protein
MNDREGDLHLRNLRVYEAKTEQEALNLLFLGNINRVTSETPMNQASSRSHGIFSITLECRPPESDFIRTSKLHLVRGVGVGVGVGVGGLPHTAHAVLRQGVHLCRWVACCAGLAKCSG